MKSVMYLVKNNLKHKTGAFKGIIVLMAIIVFSFSGSVSNSKNLDRYLNASLDHYKIGDLVMTFKGDKIPERVTDGLAENEHVTSYRADPMLYVGMECFVNGKSDDVDTRLIREKAELKVFNEDLSGFEREPPKLQPGEVYVSYTLGKLNDLSTGDALEIQTSPDTRESFKIRGFVEDPLYGTSVVAYENFFISSEDYDRIDKGVEEGSINNNYIYRTTMLHIFTDGSIKDYKLVKILNDECGLVDESMLYVTRSELVSYTEIVADTGTSLLYAFVALLAVVVGLMMLNSINSTIEMQYVDLGILKSQGFTVWQIRLAYLIQYIAALLIGSVLGLIISVPLLLALGKIFMTITGIYTDCAVDFLSCGLISAVMTAIFALFIMLSTRKLAKISPVNALNNAHKDVHFTGRLNAPIRQRGLSLTISLRHITSGLRHYVFILLIAVILMFFMTTIFDLCRGLDFNSIYGVDSNPNIGMKLFNEFEEEDQERVKTRLRQLDENSEIHFVSYTDNVLADGILYGVTACDDYSVYYKPIEGKLCEYDNEIMITRIVADELEKGIGDSVIVSNTGIEREYMIVGIIQTLSQSGRAFCMTLEGGAYIGMKPQTANVYISDDAKVQSISDTLNSEFGEILISGPRTAEDNDMMDLVDVLLDLIMGIVVGVSAIFLLVSISMICKITFLRERTNTGIFKAVGFTTGDLRLQFSLRFLLIGIIGCALGIGLAAAFTNKLLSSILRIIGITDFTKPIGVFETALPALIICLCFGLFSYISSSVIRSVQTTELICE